LKHNDSHLICGDNRTGKWAPPTFAASVHNELSHLRGAFKPHQRKSGLRKAAKSGGKNAKANNFAQQISAVTWRHELGVIPVSLLVSPSTKLMNARRRVSAVEMPKNEEDEGLCIFPGWRLLIK